MEIRHESEMPMPMPLNSSYGGGGGGGVHPHQVPGHMMHHDHHLHDHHNHHPGAAAVAVAGHNHDGGVPPSTAGGTLIPASGPIVDVVDHSVVTPPSFKKMIKYRECLKNHAAAMGANATDGCGEFMPSGDEGTLEALTCSACGCHRNFHRKEIEGETPSCDNCFHPRISAGGGSRKLFLGGAPHHHPKSYPEYHHLHQQMMPARAVAPPHPMLMSYNMGPGSLPSESDEQDEGNGGGGGGMSMRQPQMAKKRFRTKFSQEQKEKMLSFAEKVGWKIQKQEEAVVQQFCQEVGVKRRVLKVWMHNNKHNLAKKNLHQIINPQSNQLQQQPPSSS